MTTKEQKTAADKVQKLQADLVKVRADLDGNRAKMVNDPTSDAIAQAITTGQIKLEAINKALNNALDEQRRVEIEAQREATKDQVKRIYDLEGKAERDKRAVYNAIDALKKDLDELQKAVHQARYHAPDEGVEVKLLENDNGAGAPVYRVKQR